MDLLKDRIRPIYFKYLIAASGSAMVASIYGMVDAMMVGQYHGPSGNAALAVFNPVWTIIFSLGILAGIGGSVIFANRRGSGSESSAQEYFTISVIYGYLVCCAGSRGECWPTMHKMSTKLGIAVSTVQDRINLLVKLKLIAIKKHKGTGKYKNNIYVLLSQDNPEIYRDLSEPEELPMFVS